MKKILVTGATGFLGRKVVSQLNDQSISSIQTSQSLGLDLLDLEAVRGFFRKTQPEIVINCAAFVGGIQYGYKYPVELYEKNTLMNINLFKCLREFGVQKIINPIPNCIYPGQASHFKENEIWDGPMHESVQAYAFAKKGIWMNAWASHKEYGLQSANLVLPNLYGPGDHFEAERSHALGALIMKFVEAKRTAKNSVIVWGTGTPVREWMHVHDAASALIAALDTDFGVDMLNIGVGEGISIIDMANLIKDLVGFSGEIALDTSKPDGAPYKCMVAERGPKLLNWIPSIDFRSGVQETINWYKETYPAKEEVPA